jgi:hypothetical protein
MSDEPKVFEVQHGYHVNVDTEYTRRWEREHRHAHWIEIDGKFYPRDSVIERSASGKVTRCLPPPRRLR